MVGFEVNPADPHNESLQTDQFRQHMIRSRVHHGKFSTVVDSTLALLLHHRIGAAHRCGKREGGAPRGD